jgi:hypothetical protein
MNINLEGSGVAGEVFVAALEFTQGLPLFILALLTLSTVLGIIGARRRLAGAAALFFLSPIVYSLCLIYRFTMLRCAGPQELFGPGAAVCRVILNISLLVPYVFAIQTLLKINVKTTA